MPVLVSLNVGVLFDFLDARATLLLGRTSARVRDDVALVLPCRCRFAFFGRQRHHLRATGCEQACDHVMMLYDYMDD